MSKCSGKIGYAMVQETEPGIWDEIIVEKRYTGDLTRNTYKYSQNNESTNDNITLNNNISILANKFINENLGIMRYITYMNHKWKISSIEIVPPRIIITLGDMYNE